jgi:DNA polymerase-3 subunit gamma/tau
MPLHIDYRPKELKDVIGNRETIASIESILRRKKDWPHTWLFQGNKGCGKTTLARIVAKRLGIADNDLQELNIANMRGIDSAREIQERMRYKGLGDSGARGWILDEVHMGTKEFFNAMLKPLEDTPPHVYFFLCTTDPQKLPKTIIDRCEAANYKVETLSAKQLMPLLCSVIEKEGMDVPTDVLAQICQDAGGSARAALGMLDKIIDMDP